jgi:hypothetical protein
MGKNAWAIVLTALAMRQNDLKFHSVGFALWDAVSEPPCQVSPYDATRRQSKLIQRVN